MGVPISTSKLRREYIEDDLGGVQPRDAKEKVKDGAQIREQASTSTCTRRLARGLKINLIKSNFNLKI